VQIHQGLQHHHLRSTLKQDFPNEFFAHSKELSYLAMLPKRYSRIEQKPLKKNNNPKRLSWCTRGIFHSKVLL
jgi:type IV secretory pathway VirD2 relaxase